MGKIKLLRYPQNFEKISVFLDVSWALNPSSERRSLTRVDILYHCGGFSCKNCVKPDFNQKLKKLEFFNTESWVLLFSCGSNTALNPIAIFWWNRSSSTVGPVQMKFFGLNLLFELPFMRVSSNLACEEFFIYTAFAFFLDFTHNLETVECIKTKNLYFHQT